MTDPSQTLEQITYHLPPSGDGRYEKANSGNTIGKTQSPLPRTLRVSRVAQILSETPLVASWVPGEQHFTIIYPLNCSGSKLSINDPLSQ